MDRFSGQSENWNLNEQDNDQATYQNLLGDSCSFGISGLLLSGRAWRIRIPDSSPIYGLDIANNVLEFFGMMVTIWFVLIECDESGGKQECILALLGDNTSAIRWLFKSGKL